MLLWRRAVHWATNRKRLATCFSSRLYSQLRAITYQEITAAAHRQEGGKQHFPGRVLLGKLCIDAEVTEGIVVSVLEDKEHCRYYVFLCNFASCWWTARQARVWFPKDALVSIREPDVSFNKEGVPCLELLNPSSLEILGVDEDCSWEVAQSALRDGDYIRAAHLFTKFLKNDAEQALCGRSEAWLGAGMHEKALVDVENTLQMSSENILRKAKALMALQEYTSALECLEADKFVDEQLVAKCRRFVENSVHGKFDLDEYYLNKECRKCTPECGEFVGPVKIDMAPNGKGRGLFAAQDFNAGDVIFCCNPLAAMFDSSKIPAEEDLLAEMVRNCMASRRSLQQLVSLVDSEDIPHLDLFKPNTNLAWKNLVNTEFVDIPACARKTSLDYGYKFERIIGLHRQREYLSGLWILTAFANHSCAPSATQKAIGSASLVRAARDMKAGEEITLAYIDPLMPWDVRNRRMQTRWGYGCACERCSFESKLQPQSVFGVGMKMEELLEECTDLDLYEVSEMASKVERVISKWKDEKHKKWIRASYYKAYEVYLLNKREFEKSNPVLSWETIMEAVRYTAPGYEGLLTLLMVFARHTGDGCHGFSGKAKELLMQECIASFGKLKDDTLAAIIKRETEECAEDVVH